MLLSAVLSSPWTPGKASSPGVRLPPRSVAERGGDLTLTPDWAYYVASRPTPVSLYTAKINNTVALNAATELTLEGFLRTDAAILSVGVGEYGAHELGINGLDPTRTYGVLYSEESVFDDATGASAALKPVTLRHPAGWMGPTFVNIFNYQAVAVGSLGEEFRREGNQLLGRVAINQAECLEAVNEGIDQLSVGNHMMLEAAAGEYEGKAYQFRTKGPILINHVAVVPKARFGEDTALVFNEEQRHMADAEFSPEFQAMIDKQVNKAVATITQNAAVAPAAATPEDVHPASPAPAAAPPATEDTPAAADDSETKGVMSKLDAFMSKLESLLPLGKSADPPAAGASAPAADAPADASAAADTSATTAAPAMSDEQVLAAVNARFARRMEIYQATIGLLPDGIDVLNMSNKEILVKAVGDSVPDAASKTEDYLLGQATAQLAARNAAAQQRKEVGMQAADGGRVSLPGTAAPPRGTDPASAREYARWRNLNRHLQPLPVDRKGGA